MCENCKCGNGGYQPTDGGNPGTAPKPNKGSIRGSHAGVIIVDDERSQQEIAMACVREQLVTIGEDPNREGLVDTPRRVVKSWSEIYSGYGKDPKDILTVFSSDGYDQIVLLDNIEMYSMCEHHLLPFFGVAHVAYIPGEKVIGISKLARLVDMYARRAQIQERIGDQVTTALMEILKPRAAACVIEATHMCMRMRGVGKQNSVMVTSSMKGLFSSNASAKEELMQLIRNRK